MTGERDFHGETFVPEQTVEIGAEVGEPEPERIAQFIVLERIGAGGMGVVYAAYDPNLDRRVALKLVGSTSRGQAAKVRLLREAQGMARISHPNVVPVFEAGTHGDSVWLAMELVKGGTLTDWLAVERDWREVLQLFRAAGRGLAAAHAVGLIHRDFKPDNVLIGEHGRPQVADFGLVRPTAFGDTDGDSDDEDDDPDDDHGAVDSSMQRLSNLAMTAAADGSSQPSRSGSGSGSSFDGDVAALSESITRAGAMLGTPRYMAPEQIASRDVGPHSDQFAFCVALYRALFRQNPFAGRKVVELVGNVLDGKLRSPPSDTSVPRPVVEAVMRGLAHEPSDRFPSMNDLLAALEPPAPRRWGVAIGGALALTGLATALFFGMRQEEAAPMCTEGEARLAGVWDDERRGVVEDAFAELDLVHGSASFEQAAGVLDGWSEEWIAQYTDACEATHVRRDQSETALDLRMTCLDKHRQTVDAMVGLLEDPDADLVEHAAELVTDLPDSASCARVEELRAITPPTPEQEEAVATVQEALATVSALEGSGRLLDAENALNSIDPQAAAVDHPQTQAQLNFYRALFEVDPEDQGNRAAEAFAQALLANDDTLALDIAIYGISSDGDIDASRGRVAARRWYVIADALSERRGRPPKFEIALARAHAWQLDEAADFAGAEAEGRRGVELAEETFGPDSLEAAEAVSTLGALLANAGHYEQAVEQYRRAGDLIEKQLGPDHPRLVPILSQRAMVANVTGEFEQGRKDLERMIELSERVRGSKDPVTLQGLRSLGVNFDLSGEHERARDVFEDVLSRMDEREAPRTRIGLEVANSLCFVLYKLDELDEAQALCEVTLVAARKGRRALDAIVLNNLGIIARAKGEFKAALAYDREALERAEVSLGPDHAATAYSLIGIGESLILLDRHDEAIEPIERALKLREAVDNPGELAEARCLLGAALLGASKEPERARELLESSAEGFAKATKDWEERAEMCAAIE